MELKRDNVARALRERFLPVDIEAREQALHLLRKRDIAVEADPFLDRRRQLVILGREIEQRHEASADGRIDFARRRISAQAQAPVAGVAVKLKIEIGYIDGDAVALHFATTLQADFVEREQPVAADFGRQQQRVPNRVEQGCAETI
jgi:hypothetical protein